MREIQKDMVRIWVIILLSIVLIFNLLIPCHAMDVTFEWNANTEPDLDGYKVYYKTDSPGEPYNGIGAFEGDSPIDVGDVTEFTLHDLPDGKVCFFVVTAYDRDKLESDFSNEVDALSKSTLQGFNLISLYREPIDTDTATVLSAISGKYVSVWAFINNTWRVYDPANPGFTDLNNMEAGRGYWIDMDEPETLPMSGLTASNSIDLVNGSNLVGYNSSRSMAIADALASINGKYVSVWAFIDGNWRAYDPVNPGFSDLTTMEPGQGYWIDTTEPCTWTLP
jgi:hypothetical protein